MPSRPPPGSRIQPKARSGPQKWVRSSSKPLCDRPVTHQAMPPGSLLRQRPASAPPDKMRARAKLSMRSADTPQGTRVQGRHTLQQRGPNPNPNGLARGSTRPASATPASVRCKYKPCRGPAKRPPSAHAKMMSRAARKPLDGAPTRPSSAVQEAGHTADRIIPGGEELLLCEEPEELSAELEHANNLMHDRAIHELMHPNSRNDRPHSAHPSLRTVGGDQTVDLFAGLRLNDLTSVKEDEKKAEKAPRTRVVASWELRDTEDPLRPQLEFHGHSANKWTRNRLQSATVRRMAKLRMRPNSAMSAAEAVRDRGPPVRDRVARVMVGQPLSEVCSGWEAPDDEEHDTFRSMGLPRKPDQTVRY